MLNERTSAARSRLEVRNIQAVMELERESWGRRSHVERFIDAVTASAATPVFVAAHILWFGLWIAVNSIWARAFDPYPFNLLTSAVSLEAIILTSFVLMTQDRMSEQAEKREHLDLQINLLAEQELTAILKVVCLVAERVGIDVATAEPRIDQLRRQTDVHELANELGRELASAEAVAASENVS
jgi:uncharacterized membrane protein